MNTGGDLKFRCVTVLINGVRGGRALGSIPGAPGAARDVGCGS